MTSPLLPRDPFIRRIVVLLIVVQVLCTLSIVAAWHFNAWAYVWLFAALGLVTGVVAVIGCLVSEDV